MRQFEIKIQYLFAILIFLFVCTNKEIFAQKTESQLIFADEYGFIAKEEGMAFLVFHSLIDTNSSSSKRGWNEINATDTIGRYYRI